MTAEQIQQDPAYHLLLLLPHDDLLPFMQEQITGRSRTMRGYFLMNILMLAVLGLIAYQDMKNGQMGWDDLLKSFGLGTLLVFTVLIVVHEAIHGIAYKLMGAPAVSYGVNWRKFYFYAVADRFVAGRKDFIFVAIAPFVVVSVVMIILSFFVPLELKWVLFSVLFMHTGACAGDFAMLGFYEQNRHFSEMLTFDDVNRKISYFYVKDSPH